MQSAKMSQKLKTKQGPASGKKQFKAQDPSEEESGQDYDQSESQEEQEIKVVPRKTGKPTAGAAKGGADGEQKTAKASRTSTRFAALGKEEKSETGLVYVGHLPYGFVEEGLKQYFEQYGDVLRVKLMRSKKTARSKGYCFIEFKEPEVAKIAAQSMNGYLMYGRPLVCQYVEQSSRHKHQLIRSDRKFKFVPWQVIYRKAMNKVDILADSGREDRRRGRQKSVQPHPG